MSRPTFQLYDNTLTRDVTELKPLAPPRVSLYVCGPTIYNYGHIGNFRTYVAVDLLRRALKHFGYQVDHVMQFTDVDDKTIRGSRENNQPLKEFTAKYREAFIHDAKTLNIDLPPDDKMPNATDHIPSMIALIREAIEKKSAYVSDDGSVYFRIASFPKYGCLCHLDLAGMISGARVNQDEYEKEGVGDFVLWKKWVAADGDVGWDSPWGKGRPGWHIECSALSMGYLGEQIDIHGGGTDLRFPHHENEIAQSEAATGRTFVGHWFHVEHLLVDGQKMSKSLGNMYTVKDVLARGFTGRELRYALLYSAHYRSNLNFTWPGIENARIALQRVDEWRKRLRDVAATTETQVVTNKRASLQQDNLNALSFEAIDQLLSDDLNVSGLLGKLFITIRASHGEMDAGRLTIDEAKELESIWLKLNDVLGLGDATVTIPTEVQALADQRAAARKAKDFAKSDELRKAIEALGWKVKDTAKGQELLPG